MKEIYKAKWMSRRGAEVNKSMKRKKKLEKRSYKMRVAGVLKRNRRKRRKIQQMG